jgi:RNA polymerase sigma-70 factor (ECF subfamily)
VRRARDDPAAFEALYRLYRDRIYFYLRARLPGEEDAADMTQQVFLQALDRLAQYRERKGSFAAWLFAIARHAASDFYRRHKPTVEWERLPAAEYPVDSHDVEANALEREALEHLRSLLTTLPDDKREMLALRFAAGLTIPEIAAIIGKSAEATRKQLSRTLHILEEHYHDPVQ